MRWSAGGNTINGHNHYNEIQVWTTSGVNLVTTSTVVSAIPAAGCCWPGQPLDNIKDGDTSTYASFNSGSESVGVVQVDLGSVVTNARSIKFWNYWQDGRKYYNMQIMISVDGLRWVRVFGPVDTLQTSSGTEVVLSDISPSLPYFVLPYSYSYDIQPPASGGGTGGGYPDSYNVKLTDGIIAGHFWYFTDSIPYWLQWVGGPYLSPVITFNFAKVVSISKVSIYFQGNRDTIYLPASVNITTTTSTTFTVGNLGMNGWQDFSGLWSGSTITVKLASSNGYTFISEVVFTEVKRFEGCANLTTITIPTSVTAIGTIMSLHYLFN